MQMTVFGKRIAYRLISLVQPMIRFESPAFFTFLYPYEILKGWYLVPQGFELRSIRIEGKNFSFESFQRKDIAMAHPGRASGGFNCVLNFENLPSLSTKERICIDFIFEKNGKRALEKRLEFKIDPSLTQTLNGSLAARAEKQRWLQDHVCCPSCMSTESLRFSKEVIECTGCSSKYAQNAQSLNLMHSNSVEKFNIIPTGNISANAYDDVGLSIIEEVRANGGRVLDCGAGFRRFSDSTVINLEIVDFPSTDILAVGQKLPFKTGTFDYVLSLAVLEHVSDPFICAKEIIRVLKPGGKLYCIVPFLQNEHGYPDHYFNMTRSGLVQLFKDQMKLDQKFVPLSGHPVLAIHKFLSIYRDSLSPQNRKKLENLKIRDFLARSETSWLSDVISRELPSAAQWEIASTTSVMMTKS